MNLVLLAVVGALCLGLAETATRVALRDVTTTHDNSDWFSRRWRSKHPPIRNSMGFREREFSLRPPPGVVRIAVVGDSFAWGQGLPQAERFSDRLQGNLDDGFEVLNFARPGATAADHVAILRSAVLPAHPDFVLLQWYVNDVEFGARRDGGEPLRLIPSDRVTGWLYRHSALYCLIHQRWLELQIRLGWAEDYASRLRRRFGDPEGAPAATARAALLEFLRVCREASIPAAIVVFPDVDEAGFREDRHGFLLDRVLDVCAAEGIPCIDLRPVLAPEAEGRSLWVNRLDHHPGPRVHALATEAIGERLAPVWRRIAEHKQR